VFQTSHLNDNAFCTCTPFLKYPQTQTITFQDLVKSFIQYGSSAILVIYAYVTVFRSLNMQT